MRGVGVDDFVCSPLGIQKVRAVYAYKIEYRRAVDMGMTPELVVKKLGSTTKMTQP